MSRFTQQNDLAFSRLQRTWYQHLEKEGFVDVERKSPYLSSCVYGDFTPEWSIRATLQREYYILAEHYLHDNRKWAKMEHTVWGLHSEGVFNSKIAMKVGLSQRSVRTVVERHRKGLVARYIK